MSIESVTLTKKEKRYIKKREDEEKSRLDINKLFLASYLDPPETYNTTKMLKRLLRDMKLYL